MMALTFLMARCSWRFIEQPLLNLKDRFAYPRTREGLIPAPLSPAVQAVETGVIPSGRSSRPPPPGTDFLER